MPGTIYTFQRAFPSANMALVAGDSPVLVDPGFGSDLPDTERLLRGAGVPPEGLALIVNTHYHCDHAGANGALQSRYGTPIAAHRWEADLVNRRDPDACAAYWLDQPIEPYEVSRPLSEGDGIQAGDTTLLVLHTPGHTLGHISLYAPEEQVLIGGDAVHGDDVAWLNTFREGVGAIQRAIETLDRLEELPARRAISGHGPEMTDLPSAVTAARRRYEKWLGDPQKVAWHACKRIFSYALMLRDGLHRPELESYLPGCPWFADYARHIFGVRPEEFIEPLLREMVRSSAAGWLDDGRLLALAPYNPPPAGYPSGPARPSEWPPPSWLIN